MLWRAELRRWWRHDFLLIERCRTAQTRWKPREVRRRISHDLRKINPVPSPTEALPLLAKVTRSISHPTRSLRFFPPMAARLSYLAATLLAPSVHARAMQGSANSQTWCHSHALYMVYVFLAEKIADDDAKYSCRAGSVFARARMHF